MFPNFTGNSRRTRNVNLSGQRNTNPWASASGASQSVAHAQAEREKRQRERDELAASKRLQRVWRGHRARQNAKAQHRQEWDTIYKTGGNQISHADRVPRALALLFAVFDPSNPEDQRRLDQVIDDIASLGIQLDARQQDKLASVLVAALEKRHISSSQHLLSLLIEVIKNRPSSITRVAGRYYKLLAAYCDQNDQDWKVVPLPDDQLRLFEALSLPLRQTNGQGGTLGVYEGFAFSFLTSPSPIFWEYNTVQVSRFLDLQTLSQSIIHGFTRQKPTRQPSRDDLLWLLAHFIALNRGSPTSQGSAYIGALYRQLSVLASDIRQRSRLQIDDSSNEDAGPKPLPYYVKDQLEFLVNEDGITELLSRFVASGSSSVHMSKEASLLAEYTLILLRSFPSYGDDIKMRLFQGDIITEDSAVANTLPCVKFLWKAASQTSVFSEIAHKRDNLASVVALLQPDPTRDQEWRTLLLFLELYNFLLRVTDDEDFLPADNEIFANQSPAVMRIRASGLNLQELKELVYFLKNLSFTLYYNLSDIMKTVAGSFSKPGRRERESSTSCFAGIIGMDVFTLRAFATTTMRSLYERDSRRPFLPKDFWLMTSKFDMDGFLSAVVLEQQLKDELEDEVDDEENQDEEQDDDTSDAEVHTFDSFHTLSGRRISRAAQIEQQRRFKQIQREKSAAPKLEILRNMPFTIPFEVRVKIFRQFVHQDKMKRRGGYVDPDQWRLWIINASSPRGDFSARGRDILGRHTATIKRGQVFNDAYDQFYSLGEGLKEPIQITFVDQFDQPEAGIDGGGVTKEFLTSVSDEAFKSDSHSMFVANEQNLLYPNPAAFDDILEELRFLGEEDNVAEQQRRTQLLSKRYEFLGRIVGKCMYEGILIDISFAGFFLLKWSSSGQSSSDFRANLNDLRDLDPELYKGLINLKNYTGEVADLSLDFTIADRVTNPFTGETRTITRTLRKDGENIPVTNKDRPLYISYVAHHRLVAQQVRQTKAFLTGLGSIIEPSWLSMFNQSELQRLVGGDSSEIDVEDLRKNTVYSGSYAIGDDGIEHPTVQMFWHVMHGLKDEERREVLKYVTSTPRAPLLGFAQLSPRFSIRDSGTDEERLPSTSTCVNLLKLPRYSSIETLKSKLLYAIQSGAGFDLS